MSKVKIPVIAVLGPTASGKTDLAIRLAQCFGGEIVSCDSMQIYEGFDVATAKPTPAQLQLVPHHMIGILPAGRSYSVAEYVKTAQQTISDIDNRGKTVFLCGGTGLYADALLSGMTFADSVAQQEKTQEVLHFLQENGLPSLCERLQKADSAALEQIDRNNSKRVVRAVVICESTGCSLAEYKARNCASDSPYQTLRLVLDVHDRSFLYERIDRRVDEMSQNGLLEEAKAFYSSHIDGTAAQIIGYKELFPYFTGEITYGQALDNLKRATRRYAKRQLTWFKKAPDACRIFIDECDPFAVAKHICSDFLERMKQYEQKKA